MGIRTLLRETLGGVLDHHDPQASLSSKGPDLPEGAIEVLHPHNPRLLELQRRYAGCPPQVINPLSWTETYVQPEHLVQFRGDNPYVWQLRGPNMTTLGYALTTYYVKSLDTIRLLDRLEEDGQFGSVTLKVDHKRVSRDLLDSILEMYFLEKHLHISTAKDLTIVDIGAGYGRLGHRMVQGFPNIRHYLCTDAVPVSTFLSEYYLRFRQVEEKARVVPLDEIAHRLETYPVTLAVNIHSFSECRIAAIEWWISLLAKSCVPFLMIVPNALNHGGERLTTGDGHDFGGLLERYGYHQIAKDPKFRDPVVQEYGISPTFHHLFALR